MKKNNFTRAPENEPNIELVCFYDTSLSQWEFDENFKILQHSGYRTFTKAYYIDNGNVPDDDGITFTVKGEKAAMVKYLETQGCFEADEIETWDDDTLQSEIIGYMSERPTVLNYQSLNENDLDKTDLELSPSKTLVSVSISGYSQGDYAEVFYCPEDLEKCWGNKPPEPSKMAETFTRLFYDAPIYACFEINGEEYRYDEFMDDSYEWEPEKFAAIVSEKSGIALETISNFLPSHPSYN